MSSILEALKKLEQERARAPSKPVRLDMVRFEQFLDLQRDLLLRTDHPERLPDRLVQAIAIFLGTAGAAVGVVRHDVYRILATYGLGEECWAGYDGESVEGPRVAPALAGGRPLVRGIGRDLVLPFRVGALHLIAREGVAWRDEDLLEARALTALVGVALANAGLCPGSG